ncbi:hypothetical protein H4R19_003877 [Coemansia spiralis]|nr:hypothetical protein H4R19_003877 [Coemansia spiralis]
MAASTRPLAGASGYAQGPARPHATHARPPWASPSPRHGLLDTPTAPGGTRSGAFGRPPPPLGLYRPPAEYPSSVQPIRARPYATADYWGVPGSTLPMHAMGAGAAPRNGALGAQRSVVLTNWYVSIDVDRGAVTVVGSFTKPNGAVVTRHSTSIERACSERVLLAKTGTVYSLEDAPDMAMMRMRGFPDHLASRFAGGFPRNWKQLVTDYLNAVSGALHGRPSTASRPEGLSRHGDLSPLQHLSLVSPHNARSGHFGHEPIYEESEGPGDDVTGVHPTRRLSGSSHTSGPPSSIRVPVYRSGMDIFSGRYALANAARTADGFDERRMAERSRSSSNEQSIEGAGRVLDYESNDDLNAGLGQFGGRGGAGMPPLLHTASDLADALSTVPLESPPRITTAEAAPLRVADERAPSSSLSPELVSGRPMWPGAHVAGPIRPAVATRDRDSSADEAQPELDEGSSSEPPDSALNSPAKPASRQASAAPKKKTPRKSRQIVEKQPPVDPPLPASSDDIEAAAAVASGEDRAEGDADAEAMVTPTKKSRRAYFRYKQPQVSESVTRSGRKVKPPKEWWANAQEHLDSTHPEPAIRYRWGTIDAVVVRDGKRVRLSDVFREDGDADPLGGDAKDGSS